MGPGTEKTHFGCGHASHSHTLHGWVRLHVLQEQWCVGDLSPPPPGREELPVEVVWGNSCFFHLYVAHQNQVSETEDRACLCRISMQA